MGAFFGTDIPWHRGMCRDANAGWDGLLTGAIWDEHASQQIDAS